MGSSSTNRTKAFISYSHADKAYLERLQVHLKPYLRESAIQVWDDTQIPPGANWREAIERALDEAQVAILLVSVGFLASDFVAEKELPKFLAAMENDGATILPVILEHSAFQRSKLGHLQSVNQPSNPLADLPAYEQDKIWSQVAELTLNALKAKKSHDRGAQVRSIEAINRTIIGERVRLARIVANLTQQELAGTTYSKSYISAVERGRMTPSFEALQFVAERLGRSISFFLGEGEVDLEALTERRASPPAFVDVEQQQSEGEARQILIEAEEWIMKNQPDKALMALEVATNGPPAALPLYERPRWYWLAGWAAVLARTFQEAIGWLEHGLALIETIHTQVPPSRRTQLLELAERMRALLGGCYYDLGQPAKAVNYHLRCLAAITKGIVTDPELKLLIYKALGNDNMVLGRNDEAIIFYQRACKLAEDLNDPRQRGLAYWGLGLIYKSSGDLLRAEIAFREAVNTLERLDDMKLVSHLHAMLGQVLTQLEDYKRAEQHLHLALSAVERFGDTRAHAVALGSLAILYLTQGNFDMAIKAVQDGLNILRQSEDIRTEGQLLQTLGQAYEARQDLSAAEQAYKDAITTLDKTEDRAFVSKAHERYGGFLANQGRFAEAYEQLGHAQILLAR